MSDTVILLVRFVPKPGMYAKFRESLVNLIETMRSEHDFVDGILHDDVGHDGELVLYETWRGTKERWLSEQPKKPYRQAYERIMPDLLHRRDVTWLVPIGSWSRAETAG